MNTIEHSICETYQSLERVLCPFQKRESCMAEKCALEAIFWNDKNLPVATFTASDLVVMRDI